MFAVGCIEVIDFQTWPMDYCSTSRCNTPSVMAQQHRPIQPLQAIKPHPFNSIQTILQHHTTHQPCTHRHLHIYTNTTNTQSHTRPCAHTHTLGQLVLTFGLAYDWNRQRYFGADWCAVLCSYAMHLDCVMWGDKPCEGMHTCVHVKHRSKSE